MQPIDQIGVFTSYSEYERDRASDIFLLVGSYVWPVRRPGAVHVGLRVKFQYRVPRDRWLCVINDYKSNFAHGTISSPHEQLRLYFFNEPINDWDGFIFDRRAIVQ